MTGKPIVRKPFIWALVGTVALWVAMELLAIVLNCITYLPPDVARALRWIAPE